MRYASNVENIKCGGCASRIRSRLLDRGLATAVEIDIGAGRVEADPADRDRVVAKLARLGYPGTGAVEGMRATAARAKSFVSCAIGRMDNAGEVK